MALLKHTLARIAAITILCSVSLNVQAQSDDIEREFAVADGGTLTIQSDAGAIEVNTWDQNTVRVRIRNTNRFEVDVEQSGDDVDVRAEYEGGGLFGRIGRSNIGFRADVPVNYNVTLDTGGGHIEVAPINGNVDANTSGGHIEIGETTGNVQADTSGGHITIEDVNGSVLADTSGGRITIGNVTGEVSADTSGGRIEIGNVGGDMMADTSGGNITVGEGSGSVTLDTSGGTIRAAWAIGPIRADTSGGNIYLDGSETSVYADTSGGNIEIERSNGRVDADTSGGSIRIRNAVGPIRADTAGGRIEAELASFSGDRDASIELSTAGGDVTLRLPSDHGADIEVELDVSRRARDDYRIYTDFPLSLQEDDDGDITASGEINGGGDRIFIETTNSDINIESID